MSAPCKAPGPSQEEARIAEIREATARGCVPGWAWSPEVTALLARWIVDDYHAGRLPSARQGSKQCSA